MINKFRKDLLPSGATEVDTYYTKEGLTLKGTGDWRNTRCPFHSDSRPSLSINMDKGGFYCHTCEAKGGSVLDFHMRRYGLKFVDAVKALGAWEEK